MLTEMSLKWSPVAVLQHCFVTCSWYNFTQDTDLARILNTVALYNIKIFFYQCFNNI